MEENQKYFLLPYVLDLIKLLEQKICQDSNFEGKTDVWISQVRRDKAIVYTSERLLLVKNVLSCTFTAIDLNSICFHSLQLFNSEKICLWMIENLLVEFKVEMVVGLSAMVVGFSVMVVGLSVLVVGFSVVWSTTSITTTSTSSTLTLFPPVILSLALLNLL